MRAGDRAVELLRGKAGQWYYTNDAWPREHPEESGGTDCSGAVQWAYRECGFEVGGWTGAQSSAGVEVARGRYPAEIPWGALAKGDLILMTANHPGDYSFAHYDCHVELYCGGGTMIGHPGGYGPQEKRAQAWMEAYGCTTWMVRRVDGEVHAQPPTSDVEPIRFRVKTTTSNGWLPDMLDGLDTGGSADTFAGDGGELTYLCMDFPGWYQVRSEGQGWLGVIRKFDPDDEMYGCAGDGSPIIAIRCYYETPHPEVTGWLCIEYKSDDFSWMRDLTCTGNSGDDFSGNYTPIRRFWAHVARV